MEIASSLKARYVLIIAPREYSQKKIVLKNMGDGTERQIGVDEVVPFLKAEVS